MLLCSRFSFFLNNLVHSLQPWEANKNRDTKPSCQAADVLSQILSRCWFSCSAICSKALLSPSDTAHPTKTSCSHRQCCPGSRQDMIQDAVPHCCQRISNCWHACKHVITLISQLWFYFTRLLFHTWVHLLSCVFTVPKIFFFLSISVPLNRQRAEEASLQSHGGTVKFELFCKQFNRW